MAATVGIVSRRGLTIEAYHRNQPRYSKLALCKLFNNCLKQLHMRNNAEHSNHTGRYGVRGCVMDDLIIIIS